MSADQLPPLYPNFVRVRREEQHLTQAQLSALCADLAKQQPLRHVRIGVPGISLLEAGKRRPRSTTAFTLATALNTTPSELFPEGLDNPRRNPEGKTRINPNRPVRSRLRKTQE